MFPDDDDEDEQRPLMSDDEFERDLAAAARGDWEAVGLTDKFTPTTVDEFMQGT